MAKTGKAGGKSKVKDIVAALLNSEIPEIRIIIGELTECTKHLEEHSQKLKNYAIEIQELTGEEVRLPTEVNLIERLKDLEKTLAELTERAATISSRPKAEVKVAEVAKREMEEVRERPTLRPGVSVYTTPEGFIVRRLRY